MKLGIVKVKLDQGAIMPQKAHAWDAGYDIFAPIDFAINARSTYTVNTGVHIEIPEGYVGFIKSKSGLNVKYSITAEGVIDAGYTGSIRVKLYNNGNMRHKFNAGDKITQLCIIPVADCDLIEADSLEETERGDNGFGSSGR